ncbi:hypothetical protein [Streptomyces sp. NPDC050585]|uniref:DUF6197 family protein n=1 Tax=Streptomyces sp. NPDC050585 TaxID=3365632 RepID=UPI0037978DD6
MPKTTNTTTPATADAMVFTDETLRQAAELAADARRPVWLGDSGEECTGEAVARHLEATLALLEKDGWARVYEVARPVQHTADRSSALAADESMSVKALLLQLIRFIRAEVADADAPAPARPRRTLPTALRHVADSDHGDGDTCEAASRVLNLLVRAHTGHAHALASSWAERQHRTAADITALLTAGITFARTYGPGATATAA